MLAVRYRILYCIDSVYTYNVNSCGFTTARRGVLRFVVVWSALVACSFGFSALLLFFSALRLRLPQRAEFCQGLLGGWVALCSAAFEDVICSG